MKCIRCKEEKPITEFGKGVQWKDGISRYCKECVRKRSKTQYWANPEKARKYSLEKYRKNKDVLNEKRRLREEKNKATVFNAYGGYICACCGETERVFLTIDHINGGGTAHRKKVKGGGKTTYRWIRKNNYPKGFQVLCFNCNSGKWLNGGICPHEEKRRRENPKLA